MKGHLATNSQLMGGGETEHQKDGKMTVLATYQMAARTRRIGLDINYKRKLFGYLRKRLLAFLVIRGVTVYL